MIITKIYARLITTITNLARKVPVRLGSALDDLALDLVRLSRHLPPMPRAALAPGVPFIGKAVCEDLNCRSSWTLFSPLGGDDRLELECRSCGQWTGVVA